MPAESRQVFFDSNTLLYLISADLRKAARVEAHLFNRGRVSVQVLNEFVNVARRKHRLGIAEIRPVLEDLRQALDVSPITTEIHEAGLRLIERHNFSTYDAMIVAAALDAGCDILLSEDMQHGFRVDNRLTITNPFV